jgi:hypothetical protein
MAYSAIIRLTTSLDEASEYKPELDCHEKGTRDLLEHVKAVCDEGKRTNSITWWVGQQDEPSEECGNLPIDISSTKKSRSKTRRK